MAKPTITLLYVGPAGRDGQREWHYVVNGTHRAYHTVKAPNSDASMIAVNSKLNGNLPAALLADGDRESDSTASDLVALGLIGAAAWGVYKVVQWWLRDEDGPSGGFGVGFGKGNGWLNLNPLDKGKAGTGDGGGGIGAQWERTSVSGIKGWRRKGVPLPGEDGNKNTFQAAVLIVSEDGSIPDMNKWPMTLPVFFIDDPAAAYPEVEGGWLVDARFGTLELQRDYPGGSRVFSCAATSSASLTKCVKRELSETLSIQWV